MRLAMLTAPAAALLLGAAEPAALPTLQAGFHYNLSDSNGPIPSDWASLAFDRESREILTVDPGAGLVRVFNRSGMEDFTFGDDTALAGVVALTVVEGGDLVALTFADAEPTLVRCNFRGEPLRVVKPSGVPSRFTAAFSPGNLAYAAGRLYLADKGSMKVLILDVEGRFVDGHDFRELLGIAANKKLLANAGMAGFSVDKDGNILFTVSPLFQAYVATRHGLVRSFGTRGSSPGKFNVVGGIAADERGNLFVTDVLRCVVMVFDRRFSFIGEFAQRGYGDGDLVAPMDLVVANGFVFVSQARSRGVSVFTVTLTPPPPVKPSQPSTAQVFVTEASSS